MKRYISIISFLKNCFLDQMHTNLNFEWAFLDFSMEFVSYAWNQWKIFAEWFVFLQPLQIVGLQTALVALIFFITAVSFILLLGPTVSNVCYTESSLPGKKSFPFSIRAERCLKMGTALLVFEPICSWVKDPYVRWISNYLIIVFTFKYWKLVLLSLGQVLWNNL